MTQPTGPRKKSILDLGRASLEEYRESEKAPVALVLDNVRSLHNIGSIFRTADAFRVSRLMLCGITATPPAPEIHKTALGAEESVPWQYCADTLQAVASLRSEGYLICALEQVEGSVQLPDFHPAPGCRVAVIAGHEVHGVAQEVVNVADLCLEIPQYGTKHSLNVAVSAALALYQLTFGRGS